jgi:hypothetical protein
MRKFIFILFLAALCVLPSAAQSICFWTNDADAVPVRIYIDQEYLGDVTEAFGEQPLLDTPGCLSVDTTPERHSLTAVDKYGRIYKGWSGSIRPREGEICYLQLRAGQFRVEDRDNYDFVFLGWDPVFDLIDIPVRHHVLGGLVEDLDPLTDNGLLIGMGVAAVGASAALGMAAARNWNVTDERFPYVAVGLETEYFSVLEEWRNVAHFRARFGNLGGVSLMADAGLAVFPYARRSNTAFTWSVGAGLDYGGFSFSVRYKPPIGESLDTFLYGRLEYDWWISHGFALAFHAGFGVGGYGASGLFDKYDFPFGIGFLVRL